MVLYTKKVDVLWDEKHMMEFVPSFDYNEEQNINACMRLAFISFIIILIFP